MLQLAVPVVRASTSRAAEEFYCRRLGFAIEFAYRPDPSSSDPCFFGLIRDGQRLHVSSFSGDGECGASVVYFYVDDVDGLFAEVRQKDVHITLSPTDQTWGTREMYLSDLDGNRLRFGEVKQRA